MQASATALGRIVEEQNNLNRARKKSTALQNKSADFSSRIDALSKRAGNDVKGLQKIRDLNDDLLSQARQRLDVADETARKVERELKAKEDSFKKLQASRSRAAKQQLDDQKLENKVLKEAKKIYNESLQGIKNDTVKTTNANTMFAKLKKDAEEIRRAFSFADQKPQKVWGEFFQAASKERERLVQQRLSDEKKVEQAQKRSAQRVQAEAKKVFDTDARLQAGEDLIGDRIAQDIKMAQASMRALGTEIKATKAQTTALAREMAEVSAAAAGKKGPVKGTKATPVRAAASSLLPEYDVKSAQALREYKQAQQEIGSKNVQLLDQSRELFEKQTKRNKLLKAEALIFNSGAALRAGEVKTAKDLNTQAEKLLATERKRNAAARKRLNNRSKSKNRGFGDAAVSGAFPALFGGGLGQVAGGVIGSIVGSKFGLGELFGIVGSAIGGAIEGAVRFAKQLSDQLLVAASSMEALNQAGIAFSATQEKLARQARREGNFDLATQVTDDALKEQIGVDSKTLQGLAAPVTLLDNAWKRFTATAGAALGTVFAPFVALLATALEIVSYIFRAFNKTIGAVQAC